ncbi:MAG: hypothetical protein AAGF12_34535, partial [Myxococcota bacterium]
MAKSSFPAGPQRPTFSTFRALADHATVIPVSLEIFADGVTPVTALQTVGQGEGSYLLESVTGGEKWAR